MAKRSKTKAKAKYGKSAKKTKKVAKKAKKKTKQKSRPDVDPCQAEEDGRDLAQANVDEIKTDLENTDLSPAQRKKLEQALRRAEAKLKAAEAKLGRCRMQHPSHPH